jgi:hypothetical protein
MEFFGIIKNVLVLLATISVVEGEFDDFDDDGNPVVKTSYELQTRYHATGRILTDDLGDEDNFDPEDDEFEAILDEVDYLEFHFGDEYAEYGWS